MSAAIKSSKRLAAQDLRDFINAYGPIQSDSPEMNEVMEKAFTLGALYVRSGPMDNRVTELLKANNEKLEEIRRLRRVGRMLKAENEVQQ